MREAASYREAISHARALSVITNQTRYRARRKIKSENNKITLKFKEVTYDTHNEKEKKTGDVIMPPNQGVSYVVAEIHKTKRKELSSDVVT